MVQAPGPTLPHGVRGQSEQTQDWRDAHAYAPLLAADRSTLAWEWLRRNQAYRAAAASALTEAAGQRREVREGPEHWGLHAYEPPHLAAPHARPVWRADLFPYVLEAHAEPSLGDEDSFDLARLAAVSTLITAADGTEHLLLSQGFCAIRIDLLSGSLKQGPVQLQYRLAGFANAEKPLMTLQRFLTFWKTGRYCAGLQPTETRVRRLLLMLRTWDALMSGAAQREIAAELLSTEALEDRWRVGAPTLRSRVQRLVRNARIMAAGGYLSLLKQ